MPPANFPKIVGRENSNVARPSTSSMVEKLSQSNAIIIQINGENLDISKDSKMVSVNFPEIPKETDYTSIINQLIIDINDQNEYIKNTLFILEHGYIKSEDIYSKIKNIEEFQNQLDIFLKESNNIYSVLSDSIGLINKIDDNIERIQVESKDPDLSGVINSIDYNFSQLRASIENISFKSEYDSLIGLISNIDDKINKIELPQFPKINFNNEEILSKLLNIKEDIILNIKTTSLINDKYEKLISDTKECIEDNKITNKSIKIRFDNIDFNIKNINNQLKLEDKSKELKIINSSLSDIYQTLLYNNKINIDNMNTIYKLENKYNNLYSNIKNYILLSLLFPPIWMAIIRCFY